MASSQVKTVFWGPGQIARETFMLSVSTGAYPWTTIVPASASASSHRGTAQPNPPWDRTVPAVTAGRHLEGEPRLRMEHLRLNPHVQRKRPVENEDHHLMRSLHSLTAIRSARSDRVIILPREPMTCCLFASAWRRRRGSGQSLTTQSNPTVLFVGM